MKQAHSHPAPIPALPVDDYDADQAMDWVAPEDDSRVRIFLFKFLPILLLCAFAYTTAWWTSEFNWQDDVHVTNNGVLVAPEGLGLIWTRPRITPAWSPVGYSVLWPQHFVWRDKTPLGYHLINILLHSFNAFMVWMLLKRLEVVGPFVIALVFAMHPLQVESVAWIARQPQLLGVMFGLCFLLAYYRWSGLDPTIPNPSKIFRMPEGPKKLYAATIFMLALALASNSIVVCSLPFVMAVITWWKSEEFTFKSLRGLIPMMMLSIAALVINAYAEQAKLAERWGLSPIDSLLLIGRGIGFYVGKFFWPTNLTVVHEKWALGSRDLVAWLTLAGTIMATLVLWLRRGVVGKAPVTAAFVLLLLLLPTLTPINRLVMQTAYVSERFAYLPVAVLAAAVIGVIAKVGSPIVRDARWPAPVAATALVIALTCAVFFGHSNSFAGGVALWENTLKNDDDNIEAHVQLAKTYEKQKDVPKAIDLYQKVLRLTGRRNMEALIGMGRLVEKEGKGDLVEASRYYQEAIAVAPDRAEPIQNYGPALVKQRKIDQAIELYQNTIKKHPDDAVLYRLLGRALAAQSKLDEAIAMYEKSIELDRNDPTAHIDLATCFFSKATEKDEKGNLKDVKKTQQYMKLVRDQFEIAGKLDPKNFELYMSVGEMCALTQEWEYAYQYYRIACIIRPDAAEPANNVGFVLTRQSIFYWQKGQQQIARDKLKEGQVYFKRAIELKPDFESAKKNLATAQMIERDVLTKPPPVQATRPTTQATQPAK